MAKFFTFDNKELHLENSYNEQSCFIIVGGPSLNKLNLDLLKQPGIITFGVNNSPRVFRPDLWVSVDDPCNFMISIWQDPKIKKFVMHGKRDKKLWDNTKWCESNLTVGECPNVVYYKDNEYFKPTEEYLDEDTINWGNHTNRCECGFMRDKNEEGKKITICPKCGGRDWGCRSVALAAVKIAYSLGFRKIFLIGADFKMSTGLGYAWDQNRSEHSVKTNNDTYSRLNLRFSQLRPVFEKRKFYVFNATPESNLHSFIKISFEDAIKMALCGFPNTENERTYGMYERKAIDKRIEDETLQSAKLKSQISSTANPRIVKRLSQRLEKSQNKLRTAIEEKERIITWKA